MAKYVRQLYKDSNKFSVGYEPEPEVKSNKDILNDAIKEAKTIKDIALENAMAQLREAFISKTGVVGKQGVSGHNGISGQDGQTGVVNYEYDRENEIHIINGKKYTSEFINDMKYINAFHSINPYHTMMSGGPANMNPIIEQGQCAAMSGSIDVSDLVPFKTGSSYERD